MLLIVFTIYIYCISIWPPIYIYIYSTVYIVCIENVSISYHDLQQRPLTVINGIILTPATGWSFVMISQSYLWRAITYHCQQLSSSISQYQPLSTIHSYKYPMWWFGTCYNWLVVWNMNFIFPFSGECHHPNWRTHIFQG